MQLTSKYNKGIKFLSRVIYIFSKDVWVVFLKDKKGITNVNIFQSILDSSKGKPNKYGLLKAVYSITIFLKKQLDDNNIKMYLTYNEGKFVVAERFTIYKYMTAVSKNIYFNVLDNVVDKYNNTYHNSTIIIHT